MPNESTTRTAVVVGSTGIIGRAIAAKLAELGGWRVIGVTRSGGTVPGVDEAIAVDLRDPEEARRRLAPAAGATHLFFAAYLSQASWAAEVGPNLALLVNAIEGLEAVGAPLAARHADHRGQVLRRPPRPVPAPAARPSPGTSARTSTTPRRTTCGRARDAAWRWTNLVPTHLTGFATGNPMNLALRSPSTRRSPVRPGSASTSRVPRRPSAP